MCVLITGYIFPKSAFAEKSDFVPEFEVLLISYARQMAINNCLLAAVVFYLKVIVFFLVGLLEFIS
jgi:hypothetical protein